MKKSICICIITLICLASLFAGGWYEWCHIESYKPTNEWGEIISETYWLEGFFSVKERGTTSTASDLRLFISLDESLTWNIALFKSQKTVAGWDYSFAKDDTINKSIKKIEFYMDGVLYNSFERSDGLNFQYYYMNNEETPDSDNFIWALFHCDELKIRIEGPGTPWSEGPIYGIAITGEDLKEFKIKVNELRTIIRNKNI